MIPRSLVGLTLVAALALTGCSANDDSPTAGAATSTGTSSSTSTGTSSGASASESAQPYLPVPDGVSLTPQGSRLRVGDDAVVAYEPRQNQVAALDITVTRLDKTTFKKSFSGWKIDAATLKTTPYFVHATVKNVGDTKLGGRSVPLYIVDGTNTLIRPSTFESTFAPCPSNPLPGKFKSGDKTRVCLVYLAPHRGDLTAVSFRPTQDFDPITWTGKLLSPGERQGTKGDGKKKG